MLRGSAYRVLAFAREAGGAQAIAPVVKELQAAGAIVLVTAKDVGLRAFAEHGFAPRYLEDGDDTYLAPLLGEVWGGQMPDIVLTSAASLAELDMTEKHLWLWARDKKIRSVAVLDQWQNYARRFSSSGSSDLAFLPDMCCVMDAVAERGMVAEGFPAERLAVTGQPAFDALAAAGAETGQALALKQQLGMDNARPTLVFVGEALREHWGKEYGYDERSCLNALLDILEAMPQRPNLIVKKHPQNVDEDFDLERIKLVADTLLVRIVGMEQPANRVILAADIVVGMSSVLLVESVLLGKISVSIEIGAKVATKCFPVEVGAIPPITDEQQARLDITRLIADKDFAAAWLTRQSLLQHRAGAARRVAALVLADEMID